MIVLTLGLFGRAQRPAALFGALYAPCGPFLCFICALRLFSMLYMRPSALSDPLFICTRWPFLFTALRPSVRVCVCKSPKRFLNARTQKFSKCTKNREKIQKVTWPFSKNSVYNYRRNELKIYLYEPKNEWKLLCFAVFLAKMPSEIYWKRKNNF